MSSAYIIKRECDRIKSAIPALERKIHATSGFIFKSHTYSDRQLIREVEKLESKAGSMAATVESWVRFGSISNEDLNEVTYALNDVKGDLEFIRSEVDHRVETFWESVRQPIIRAINKIGSLIGLIPSGFLDSANSARRLLGRSDD